MSKQIVVIDPAAHALPFEALEWGDFELFCADLLASDREVLEARNYLKQGNKQEGIDAYAIPHHGGKITVAQCKRKAYIPPGELPKIANAFLKDTFRGKVNRFILCTSNDFNTSKAEKAIEQVRADMKAAGIDFVLWDKQGLERELRDIKHAGLVCRYFNEAIARAFYGDTFTSWLRQYRRVEKIAYEAITDYIPRTLSRYADVVDGGGAQHYFGASRPCATLADVYASGAGPKKGRKAVVLSVAGFGKTWEMRQLAAHYSADDRVLMPVLSYLRDYEGQSIDEILRLRFGADWEQIPKEALLLIFDGLDEIGGNHFQAFVNHLNQFATVAPAASIVVSGRFNFYDLAHPPLRDFEVYLLDEFAERDVQAYLAQSLPQQEAAFDRQTGEAGLAGYVRHPYYLARLVRFFQERHKTPFPKGRPALFERILFERFEADKQKYGLELKKPDFLAAAAQKVAFCLTMLGKSSLNEDELEAIIPERDLRDGFKKFFLLMPEVGAGRYAFEHKNLQEFLCADFLRSLPFDGVKQLLTFPHAPEVLQPRFLNTVSFLFEMAGGAFFQALFDWLRASQPDVLVRFEKDRIPQPLRKEIVKQILHYYGSKDLSLHSSSQFTIEELGRFLELDPELIDFLDQHLADPATSDWIAFDIVHLLAAHRKAYVFKARIRQIILGALPTRPHFHRFAEGCIDALTDLRYFSKDTAEAVLHIGIDLKQQDIREAMVRYLDKAGLAEEYAGFVMESIAVYETQQDGVIRYGRKERLERIISDFKKPESIRKALRWMIAHPERVSKNGGTRRIHFKPAAIAPFLANAKAAFTAEPAIISAVYRLFWKGSRLPSDKEYATAFRDFFNTTCGSFAIFKKLYRYRRREHDMMLFATHEGCAFLLDEYRSGKISDEAMTVYRNMMSWRATEVFRAFQDTLVKEFGGKFAVDETQIDYQQIRRDYEVKNQQMLLDRDLFFEEVKLFGEAIGKESFVWDDLHSSENRSLIKLDYSLVAETVKQRQVSDIPQTMEEVIGDLRMDESWEWFKINEIKEMLSDKKEDVPIDPQIIQFAEAWCKEKLETLDYESAVKEEGEQWTINNSVQLNNELFALLRPDVEDRLLLQMLLTDFEGGMNRGELGLSGMVIEQVRDKALLKSTVLGNLEKDLPLSILMSHFAVCHHLHYHESLPKLYEAISNPALAAYNQIKLVDYYLALGGSAGDFMGMMPGSPPPESHYSSLVWHLLEKMKTDYPDLVTVQLLRALEDEAQDEANKLQACRLLIRLNRLEGLRYWRDCIIRTQRLPFDHHQDVILEHGPQMPLEELVPILEEVLAFAYANNLHETLRFPDSITEAAYAILRTVAMTSLEHFQAVNASLDRMVLKYSGKPFLRYIHFQKERAAQEFYKQHVVVCTLPEAIRLYGEAVPG